MAAPLTLLRLWRVHKWWHDRPFHGEILFHARFRHRAIARALQVIFNTLMPNPYHAEVIEDYGGQ